MDNENSLVGQVPADERRPSSTSARRPATCPPLTSLKPDFELTQAGAACHRRQWQRCRQNRRAQPWDVKQSRLGRHGLVAVPEDVDDCGPLPEVSKPTRIYVGQLVTIAEGVHVVVVTGTLLIPRPSTPTRPGSW